MYSAARLGSLVNDISSQVLKAIELSLLQLHRHLCRRETSIYNRLFFNKSFACNAWIQE